MERVIVVDGYSSGVLLAEALHKRGYEVIHVRSTPEVPEFFRGGHRPDLYLEDFSWVDLSSLAMFRPVAVLAGSESGVLLADYLSEKLGLRTNGTALSLCRRNKYEMVERLRACGIPAARQFFARREKDLLRAEEIGFPLVLKPLDSAGTDGVFVFRSSEELSRAYREVLGKKNIFGAYIREVVVQEFLEGIEYVVDTVSRSGRHLVTDVCVYEKVKANGRERIYDTMKLVDFREDLASYFFRVLNALGIQNGPAHGEIMLTSKGPRLVEVGARLAGVGWPALVRLATGYGPIEATIDAYLNPRRFLQKQRQGLTKKGEAWMVVGISRNEGRLRHPLSLVSQGLKSLISEHWEKKRLRKTVDLLSAPGYFQLFHRDPEVIARDYRRYRERESEWLRQGCLPVDRRSSI